MFKDKEKTEANFRLWVKAVLKNDINGVKKLINDGIDVNIRIGDFKETALMRAVDRYPGNEELIKTLIRNGADLDAQESFRGDTVLMWAARSGRVECVRALIYAGADLNVKNKYGQTAIEIADNFFLQTGEDACFKLLTDAGTKVSGEISSTDKRTKENAFDSVLVDTIRQKDLSRFKELIKDGTNVNEVDIFGRTVVMDAVRYVVDRGFLKALIEAGADLEVKDPNGDTVVMKAASYGDVESLKLLIEAGVDLRVENNRGKTVSQIAAKLEEDTCLKMIVDAERKLGVKNKKGFTLVESPSSPNVEDYELGR